MVTEAQAQHLLEAPIPTDELLPMEKEQVKKLVEDVGFHHLLRLMLGARQAQYMVLSNIMLGDPSNVARASVIQGQIKGIDMLRETVLELFKPVEGEGAKD